MADFDVAREIYEIFYLHWALLFDINSRISWIMTEAVMTRGIVSVATFV